MKEIKFRIFDKQEEDFLNEEDYAINFVGTIFKACLDEEVFEVLDENMYIVTQYTGLKDKNGVLIFEGDIVTTPYRDTNGYIYYSAPTFGLKDKTGVCVDFTWEDFNEFEVIGNIYENPELLKKEN